MLESQIDTKIYGVCYQVWAAHLSQQALQGLDGLRLECDGHSGTVAGRDGRPHKVCGEIPLRAHPLKVLPPELQLHQAAET